MPCYSPLKGWKDRATGGITFRRCNGLEKMEVACGQCLGCRLDYSRMWAMRIVHECSMHEHNGGNCFITLTYRDKWECDKDQLDQGLYIPDDWSLHQEHMQNFFKRLRNYFPDQKIKYFYVGEYGHSCEHGIDLGLVDCPLCNVGRPHYHCILFNCSFVDLESYGSDRGELRYTSPTLEKLWKYGYVDVGEANFESAAYCARYSLKKITGVQAKEHYMKIDEYGVARWVKPEYARMSRGHRCKEHRGLPLRPADCPKCSGGIGADFYAEFKSDMFPRDTVPIPGRNPIRGMPRYYQEIFASEEPLTMEEIKERRQRFMSEHADEYTPERLMDKYKVKKAQLELLRRDKC